MELEYLVNLLDFYGFSRTSRSFSLPLVIHGVAGCGKSTIISKVSCAYPKLISASFSPQLIDPDSGRRQSAVDGSTVDLLDEYLAGINPTVRLAKFCDPLQYDCQSPEEPHYRALHSHRFCPATAQLLNKIFGCHITSKLTTSATIRFADAFAEDPEGQVITFEPELESLLTAHGCPTTPVADLWGRNIPYVSVYTSSIDYALENYRSSLFLALTRHQKQLLIFDLDARADTPHEL